MTHREAADASRTSTVHLTQTLPLKLSRAGNLFSAHQNVHAHTQQTSPTSLQSQSAWRLWNTPLSAGQPSKWFVSVSERSEQNRTTRSESSRPLHAPVCKGLGVSPRAHDGFRMPHADPEKEMRRAMPATFSQFLALLLTADHRL